MAAINLKSNYTIIEASSFQLSHSKFIHPDYAFFFLNLSNDHLDWHGSKSNYLKSKFKIFQLQTKRNYAIVNKNYKNFFLKKNYSSNLIIPRKKKIILKLNLILKMNI